MATEYAIQNKKTRMFLRFHTGGIIEWCVLGEGEARFGTMTEAVLSAMEHRVDDREDYHVVLVESEGG